MNQLFQGITMMENQYINTRMIESLSNREHEVLLQIAYGNTNAEIADILILSKSTVATYRKNIYSKLHVKNGAGMVRKAFEGGILVLNEKNKITLKKFQLSQDLPKEGNTNDR